jgi:hypothetical protein
VDIGNPLAISKCFGVSFLSIRNAAQNNRDKPTRAYNPRTSGSNNAACASGPTYFDKMSIEKESNKNGIKAGAKSFRDDRGPSAAHPSKSPTYPIVVWGLPTSKIALKATGLKRTVQLCGEKRVARSCRVLGRLRLTVTGRKVLDGKVLGRLRLTCANESHCHGKCGLDPALWIRFIRTSSNSENRPSRKFTNSKFEIKRRFKSQAAESRTMESCMVTR